VATGIEETARTKPAADIAAGTAVETMTYSSDALVPSAGMAWLATNFPPSVPQRLQIRCPPQILLLLAFYFAVILHPRKKTKQQKSISLSSLSPIDLWAYMPSHKWTSSFQRVSPVFHGPFLVCHPDV